RIGKEEPDFLSSDDSWFRPVYLQLGPDGAIYVADFYNRIIGHYEVALNHPGRDRERGRIWRIAYVGDGAASGHPLVGERAGMRGKEAVKVSAMFDFTHASIKQLLSELANPNITRRMLAMNQLVDR